MKQWFVYWLDQCFPKIAVDMRLRLYRHRGAVEVETIDEFVKSGDYVLDIGARRGIFTVLLSEKVGPSGRVDAFEPLPTNVGTLQRLVRNRDNTRILDIALSSKACDRELTIPLQSGVPLTALGSFNNHHEGEEVLRVNVHCQRLDDLIADRTIPVSFIKCDVEGHELEVMRGSRSVLETDQPVVLMEIEQRHCELPIASRFSFMEELGYKIFAMPEGQGRMPLAAFDPDVHQNTGLGRSVPHGYINMFLFLPNRLD